MVLLAVGGAALFSQADQAERIATDARLLGDLQAAAADTATHRAALVIAFASIRETVPEVTLEAVAEAVSAVDRIAARLDFQPDLRVMAITLAETTDQVGQLLEEGDVDDARALVEAEALPVVSQLATNLGREIAILRGRIEGEQARAGSLARAASFVVALVVPVLAVVLVRRAARRRLERDRLESEMLRQKELAEARDRLIAGLSHQLRTPITGIYGWSELLRESPNFVEEGSLAILDQAGNLARMVDDILVAARIDTTHLAYKASSIEVGQVVANAVSHFRRVGHDVRVDCEDAVINVDGARVEQAIHNLVANALQHGQPPVEIVGRTYGSVYRLAVIDGGSGLDEQRGKDPFAAFAHAPEDLTTANSLGLGLSVADSLARMFGPGIEYLRQDGHTVFALTIPLGSVGSEGHTVSLRTLGS